MKRWFLLVGLTVGLVVAMGVAGTVAYLAGVTGYAPLAWALVPIAIGLCVVIAIRGDWAGLGFTSLPRGRGWVIAGAALIVLPLPSVALATGFGVTGAGLPGYVGLALLVAFVEEAIFRGILWRAFRSQGLMSATLITSAAFALAHTVTAISPDADQVTVVKTVVFAFLFGVLAALLVETTGSIWPAIAVHAAFDLAGFVLVERSAALVDTLSICSALGLALVLIWLARTTGQRSQTAH